MERPDTVAFAPPNRATLIEVKELWTNEAVWQLSAYRDFYREAYPDQELALAGVAAGATPNGRELARKVLETRPEMKVLYMSGYTDNAIVHNGILDADLAFLQKPITPDVFARKVRKVLDGRE